MPDAKRLTFAVMDPPFENGRSTTALRLVDAALRKGFDVDVFAYEGGVVLPFARQKPHPNPVHGTDAEAEDHPLPRAWVASLLADAEARGRRLTWVNCGLCADERGVDEVVDGVVRGGPANFLASIEASVNTLVIPTRS